MLSRDERSLKGLKTVIQHSALEIVLLSVICVLLNSQLQAQSQKDYVYLDGKLIAIDSQQNSLQPTCLKFVPTIGFAGISAGDLEICNGAKMKVWVRYNFTPWQGGEVVRDIEDIAGTADASGRIVRNPLPQNTTPGTSVVTAIKNDLRADWYQLPTPYPQFIMRPAKPQDFLINNTTSYEVILPGSTTESARNSQNQTVETAYRMIQPIIQPGGNNEYWYFPFPMDGNAAYSNDSHPCEVGNTNYTFYKVRNQLDSYDSTAWTNVATNLTYTKGSSCPNFQLQFQSSATQTTTPGQTAQYQFKVLPSQGFARPVTLSVTGLPAGSAPTFSQNPVNPNQAVTLTISTPSNIGLGNYKFTINGTIAGFDAGGWISRSLNATLTVQAPLPPQPTCFEFLPTIGFAGIDPSDIHICGAPNMTIEVQYTWVQWSGQWSWEGQDIAGTTDSTGWIRRSTLPQDTAPGTSYITAYRNILRADWVVLTPPYPTFIVRPPKPTGMYVYPYVLQLPGSQDVYVGNEQNQPIAEYVQNPDGTTAEYGLYMDWQGAWYSYLPCGVMPGKYSFLAVRNALDPYDDAWTPLYGVDQTILACGP
jgi:hypothetical protein